MEVGLDHPGGRRAVLKPWFRSVIACLPIAVAVMCGWSDGAVENVRYCNKRRLSCTIGMEIT
jgi:hypothetical protein